MKQIREYPIQTNHNLFWQINTFGGHWQLQRLQSRIFSFESWEQPVQTKIKQKKGKKD